MIVADGARSPVGWEGAERVVVDAVALADPGEVVEALHRAWATRTPIVIDLHVDPAAFRDPVSYGGPLWERGPGFEPSTDRLHFLVWANSYDAIGGREPYWWWGRKATRLGATEGGEADVVLPDGTPAWIDGGPRAPLPVPLAGAAVVHRESVELGRLVPQPALAPSMAELASDQLEAVGHGAG
ncbi:MAG: hypothetical protein Q8K72_18845, partial [Acidimicrobiales bacterium]|nr:hypothetical protein [Acidimicrobiales bacterium]